MGYYDNLLNQTAILKTTANDEVIATEDIDIKLLKSSFFTNAIVKAGDLVEIDNEDYVVKKVVPYFPFGSCSDGVINEVYLGEQ